MGNEAIPTIQTAVNKDPGLDIDVRVHITAAIYAMFHVIGLLGTQLGNIPYLARG